MSDATVIMYGWEVDPQVKRLYSDSPTTLRLHKLGSADSHWFTAAELRAFARWLEHAADGADGKPPAHHDEEPRLKRIERDLERLEGGLERIREALLFSDGRTALAMLERLQAGGQPSE